MEIQKLGQIAISPDKPSGDDVRYELEYEEVQAEIEKLSSPTSQGATNWKRVVELATAILTEKSKNILMASYLSVGLLHTQGPEGLAPGVSMYRGLIENFWDTLYPPKKRKKARLNAVEWWLDKNLEVLDNLPEDFTLTATEQKTLTEDIDALESFLGEQSDDAPMLYQMKNRIQNIPVTPDPETDGQDLSETDDAAPTESEPSEAASQEASEPAPETPSEPLFSPEDEAIVNIGKIPISPDAPSGEDVRYEPEYEEMQAEIEKLSSPSSQDGINWNNVLKLTQTILTEKSKNILAASYMCAALMETKGPVGLAPGIAMYRGLIENFWDSFYPPKKRKKARYNAIEWWLERNINLLENLPNDFEMTEGALQALSDDIDAMDAFLAEKADDAPMLYQIKNRLKNIPVKVQAPPPEEKPEPPPPAPEKKTPPKTAPKPKPKPAPKSTSQESEELEEDASALIQSGLERLIKAALLMVENEPSNAVAYRLVRLSAWLEVDDPPPAENGQTMIPPPMEEFMDVINRLHENNNYANLVEAVESRVGQYPFWLDLSRYTSEALTQLGFQAARDAVEEETARYVKRVQGIEKLTFSDGTPFADPVTQGWLRDIAVDQEGGGAGGGDSVAAEMAEIYGQAQTLAREKKLPEALELLQENFRQAGSDRAKLMGRMNIARLLNNAGKPNLALPHLFDILDKIDAFGLENWDPDFALNALTVVYDGLQAQQDETLEDKIASVLGSISKLSPAAAVRLAG